MNEPLYREARPGDVPVECIYHIEVPFSVVPWCAAHNRPIPNGHTQCDHGKYTDDCRLEEPARHIVLMREEAEPIIHPMHVAVEDLFAHVVNEHAPAEDLNELMEFVPFGGVSEFTLNERALRGLHGKYHRQEGSDGCQYHPTIWNGCSYCDEGRR